MQGFFNVTFSYELILMPLILTRRHGLQTAELFKGCKIQFK